jgi:hypothetical protein
MNIKLFPFILFLYILCLTLTFFNHNSFLIAGEHLTTNNPLIVINNLINNLDWFNDSLVRHSSLPRGMHQGPINNIFFYLIIYLGSLLYLDSTSTQLFFGLTLQYIGIRFLLKNSSSRFDNFSIIILFIFYATNYQNLELILGGGFFAINLGILTLIIVFLELILNKRKLSIIQFIIFTFLIILFIYIGIVWINILIIICLIYFFRNLIKNKEIINNQYLKASLISLFFVLPYLYIIYINPIPYYWSTPPQEVIFALTSGIYKRDITGNIFINNAIKIILISILISILIYDAKKSKNYSCIFLYAFFCLWELSNLGDMILNHIPLFHNFRATYKLSIITTLILLYVISKNILSSSYIKIAVCLIIAFQFYYIFSIVKYISYIKVPVEYFQAQSYLNTLDEKKIILPFSQRDTFMSNSYSWFKKPELHLIEYPSNIFSTIIPVNNGFTIDEIDNPSFMLSSMQIDYLKFRNIKLFMRKYNFKYLIYDNNKISNKIDDFSTYLDLKLIKTFGKIDIYELSEIKNSESLSIHFIDDAQRKAFFKQNINKKGLLDYVNDRYSLNYFINNNINPFPIFEIQNPWTQPQFENSCLKINKNIKRILFYNTKNELMEINIFSKNLYLRNTIIIEPKSQISITIPRHNSQYLDYCLSTNIQGSIFFSPIF